EGKHAFKLTRLGRPRPRVRPISGRTGRPRAFCEVDQAASGVDSAKPIGYRGSFGVQPARFGSSAWCFIPVRTMWSIIAEGGATSTTFRMIQAVTASPQR